MNDQTVVIAEGMTLRLTTPEGEMTSTCIYVTLIGGKLVLSGGSSIIKRIEGGGMREKVFNN